MRGEKVRKPIEYINSLNKLIALDIEMLVPSHHSPVTGKVVEVNKDIEDNLDTIVDSPYEDGWLIKVEPSDPTELDALMDAAAYSASLE